MRTLIEPHIYQVDGGKFHVFISVRGRTRYFGSWTTIEAARGEKDRVLALRSRWNMEQRDKRVLKRQRRISKLLEEK